MKPRLNGCADSVSNRQEFQTIHRHDPDEASNTIQDDFARILVITHIDELRDAFPTRIEVVKTLSGSGIVVV
jgi:hypothetical protein